MKLKKRTLIALLLVSIFSCSQDKIVELPLTIQNGFSPFHPGLVVMDVTSEFENHPMNNSWLKISKFPEGLTDIKYGDIISNMYQFVFQNYVLGNIPEDWYKKANYHKIWENLDTLTLSRTPIRTQIAFAYGKDSEGNLKIAVDVNGNLDLSDDKLFTALEMTTLYSSTNVDSLVNAHIFNVPLEIFVKEKIAPVNVPLLIIYNNRINKFMYGLSLCATSRYKGEQIAVSPKGVWLYQYEKGGNDLKLALINNLKEGERVIEEDIHKKDDYIEIKNEIYKIIGVNVEMHTLVLEKTGLPKSQLFTTQVGFKPYPFQEEEFTTKTAISLEDFKGKYVFLDFWAEWCAPCIAELPYLKELYSKTDRTKFEIIGIAGRSTADGIKRLIEQYEITWFQILSDEIVKMYGITSFPTTILLDTEGFIVAKNLRGVQLEEKILSLIK